MGKVTRTLDISLASHSRSADEAMEEQRHAQLEMMPGLVGKEAALFLDRLAKKHRSTAINILNLISVIEGGPRYIGNGAFVSVYKDGDEVVKVYRHTACLDEAARQGYMISRAEMCERLKGYLGKIVVPQAFFIGQHPLGDYRVVLARQPYVRGGKLDFFKSNTLSLNETEVAGYCEYYEEGESQIRGLVDATFASHDGSGEVPDLNGCDNIRLVDPSGQIKLIDAEPISEAEHPGVHRLVLDQATILGNFVQTLQAA